MQGPTCVETLPKRAVSRNKNYWQEVISSWQKSNESPKEFCARMNINLGTFAHWRGVFKKLASRKETKFIELTVTQPAQNTPEPITIECPTGHKILLSSLSQAHQFIRLLRLI